MALEVYYRDDIRNTLLAALTTLTLALGLVQLETLECQERSSTTRLLFPSHRW